MNTTLKKRLAKTLVVLVACGSLVLAGGLLLMPANEAGAIFGCPSPGCGAEQVTPTVTGVSTADCPWAEMDAENKAQAHVSCPDGICNQWLEIIDDNDCKKYWPSGEFRVEARIHYSCAECS